MYSWMLGAEINRPYYSTPTTRPKYAAWNLANIVALYPSVFSTPALARGDRSTHYMEHFVAYLQGAEGNSTVNPTADDDCLPWDNRLPPYPPARAEDTAAIHTPLHQRHPVADPRRLTVSAAAETERRRLTSESASSPPTAAVLLKLRNGTRVQSKSVQTSKLAVVIIDMWDCKKNPQSASACTQMSLDPCGASQTTTARPRRTEPASWCRG